MTFSLPECRHTPLRNNIIRVPKGVAWTRAPLRHSSTSGEQVVVAKKRKQTRRGTKHTRTQPALDRRASRRLDIELEEYNRICNCPAWAPHKPECKAYSKASKKQEDEKHHSNTELSKLTYTETSTEVISRSSSENGATATHGCEHDQHTTAATDNGRKRQQCTAASANGYAGSKHCRRETSPSKAEPRRDSNPSELECWERWMRSRR